jgi:hypothetical protein
MNRRDFLLLRRERETRVLEVSCQRLCMRYLDTLMDGVEPTEGDAPDRWGHEPPLILQPRTTAQLFEGMARDLQEADVVRLVDPHWIKEGELSDELDRVLGDFKRRGGKVEVVAA